MNLKDFPTYTVVNCFKFGHSYHQRTCKSQHWGNRTVDYLRARLKEA